MSEEKVNDVVETTVDETNETAAMAQGDVLVRLQQENDELKGRLGELVEAQADRLSLADRLGRAERESTQLRRQCAEMALVQAVDEAAVNLGISPAAAGVYRSRFTCELDAEGKATITPDPAELLESELKDNPLLRESLRRGLENRQATAVADGAAKITTADPVQLISALDRTPAQKAQFISRHGPQAFIDLAQTARKKGYRG